MFRSEYLSSKNVFNFYKLHFPDVSDVELEKKSQLLLKKLETEERNPKNFILLFNDDTIIWSFLIFKNGGDSYGIQTPKYFLKVPIDASNWQSSINLIQDRLLELKYQNVSLRFTKSVMVQNLGLAITEINFEKKNERIEFKSMLANLPNNGGTPIKWKSVGSGNLDLEYAAHIMSQCSVGDPDSDPSEKAIDFLKTYLEDVEYKSKLEAIQIGYIDEKPAGFVFAQVVKESGWSRITYMGLIPEFRGRGLGRWVHRKGFEMMRSQGGTQYFGGTTTDNKSMLATFRSHGCEEYQSLEEWVLKN